MAAVIRTAFTAGVALTGAGVIAVSPVAPAVDVSVPILRAPAVELTAAPALGALPYQVLINQLANVIAVGPIVLGSTEQCTTCLGPVPVLPGSAPVPFSGWGAVGITAGLLSSPMAFVESLRDTGDVGQAIGTALLAVQTPITNTLFLLEASRIPDGGFEISGALARAFVALVDTIVHTTAIAAQALVNGPLTVGAGLVLAGQTFATTLAATGDPIAAFNAGSVPLRDAVSDSLAALSAEVEEGRTTVYNDLLAAPTGTTFPIPTVSTPAAAVPPAAVTGPPQAGSAVTGTEGAVLTVDPDGEKIGAVTAAAQPAPRVATSRRAARTDAAAAAASGIQTGGPAGRTARTSAGGAAAAADGGTGSRSAR